VGFPPNMHNFLGEAGQPIARISLGRQPIRGMHQAVINKLPLCNITLNLVYLMKQDKVL